jgi:hypothetical protein
MPEPEVNALSLRDAVAEGEQRADAQKHQVRQDSRPGSCPKIGHAPVWPFKSECGVNWFKGSQSGKVQFAVSFQPQ